MGKRILLLLSIITTFLVYGCGAPTPPSVAVVGEVINVGSPETRDLSPTTEIVPNCSGSNSPVVKHPSMTAQTTHSIEWEFGGQVGFGAQIGGSVIPGGVDLSSTLSSSLSQSSQNGIQQGTAWDLPADPNTKMEYTLAWREIWQHGYVNVNLSDGRIFKVNVTYRTGIESDITDTNILSCGSGQEISTQPVVVVPTQAPQSSTSYCYGNCWQFDGNSKTMTWTGSSDGIEDIWQPSGEPLQNIRSGYTAIINTSVPGEIFACVLTVNGQSVMSSCGLYQLPAGSYQIKSANNSVGGFRWCPAIGYGWRVNGGECK